MIESKAFGTPLTRKRQRQGSPVISTSLLSGYFLPDKATIREPDCVFQSQTAFHADSIEKVNSAVCEQPKYLIQ